MKKLYFADCLDVLKDFAAAHPEGFIDLVYIDPPFNSKRDYNVLFESIDLKDTKAQKEAFADTWSNVSYLDTLAEIQELDLDLYNFLNALDNIRISKGAIAYLTTMAIRIYYIHKVIKSTGSFYLHCDPTMSHYLKLLLDLVFGGKNYRNEIIWERSLQHNLANKRFDSVTDTILFYTKSEKYYFKPQYEHLSEKELLKKFPLIEMETGRRFQHRQLEQGQNAGSKGEVRIFGNKEYRSSIGWRWSQKTINEELEKNPYLVYWTSSGKPRYKIYADEYEGRLYSNLWKDIPGLTSNDTEALGYPTQKNQKLLERIINASSRDGDLIADFFCGCGTTIAAAEKLNRNWIGTDISHLAIKLILDRLTKPYDPKKAVEIRKTIEVTGFPKDIDSAKMLAQETENGRFNFQDWVIEVLMGGVANQKKIADGGYDGYLTFAKDEKMKGIILIEVKSGNVNVKNIREFIQVIEKQKADLGAFICFKEQVTQPMLLEAKKHGYFDDVYLKHHFDKIQIITVEDLMEGKGVNLPYRQEVFKKATKTLIERDDEMQKLFE